MKKLLACLLTTAMLFSFAPMCFASEALPEMQVEVKAKAAVLMDAGSGKVLMAQNAHEKLYPASVTKIMTLLLVTEAIDSGKISLTDIVTVSKEAAEKGGSQIWLEVGEQMSVDDLLKASAVASANDACEALAEYVAGSSDAFVRQMNERAKQLGMNDTHFENCTGLDDTVENHVTSAYDVALMSRELLRHQRITGYTTIWMDSLRNGETQLVNTNKLIRFYEGATGLKTGTTSKAGCCVSASAKRGDLHLIAVVLGSDTSDDRFNAARAMLDWGFANYTTEKLEIDASRVPAVGVLKGTESSVMPVIPQAQAVLIEKGKTGEVVQEFDLAATVQAPVEKGQLLGRVYFKLNGETLYTYDLISDREIPALTFFESFKRILLSLCT